MSIHLYIYEETAFHFFQMLKKNFALHVQSCKTYYNEYAVCILIKCYLLNDSLIYHTYYTNQILNYYTTQLLNYKKVILGVYIKDDNDIMQNVLYCYDTLKVHVDMK